MMNIIPTAIEDLNSSVFGAQDVAMALPKEKMPEHSMRAEDAYQLIDEELLLDGNARQNLATFCQTWDDPQVRRLMNLCIDKNLIDKDEYPQTAQIEMRCVAMLADLWNAPKGEPTVGCATIGSSEACMLAGMAALWRWRARQQAAGKPIDKPNLVCGPVQICWHKFCRYWGVEMRELPMAPNDYGLTPEKMLTQVDENTIVVMTTFGLTYTGQYEDTAALCAALDKLAKDGGPDIDLHVDAASGGFLAPFLAPELKFDFRLARVKSISASGHKYGLAPLGCGWVLWREPSDMPKDLTFEVNYLGGSVPTIAINFSRPAGQIIAQYYDFVRLGREGYRRIHQACYDVAAYVAEQFAVLGEFDFISTGAVHAGIPAVCFSMKADFKPGFDLYELSDRLRMRGGQVPAYSLPADVEDMVVMRVMIRQGFSMDMANLLMSDVARAMDFLASRAAGQGARAEDIMSFKHT
ncbi:MAG: glutamate decarboxylase [Akkermansia sp.]